MGIGQSSTIVTNGLIFNYDMYNTKSYKGPPLRNHIAAISPTVQSGTGYVLTGGTEIVDIPTLGQTNVTFCNLQNTGSSWCCVNFMNYGNAGNIFIGSTLYTYLILYRSDSGYTNGNWMYRYEYSSSGTYQTEAGVHTTGNRTYLGNGWYYAWGTFTTQAATTNLTCYSFSYNYSSFNDKISVAKVCILPGNYSGLHPRYWPDTNTTRNNTNNLIDLTNRNSIVTQSLTYNSDGTFTFIPGNFNYIDSTSSVFTGTGSWTMGAWFKINGAPTNSSWQNVIVDTDATGGSANMIAVDWGGYHGGSQNQLVYATRPSTGGSYTNLLGPVLTQGVYYHVMVVRNSSFNTKLYVNGVLNNTYNGNMPTAAQSLIRIGRWTDGTNYANATIPSVQIYDRALLDTEVQQNFNAQRGLYGI